MTIYLRQSTASQEVPLGPFLDDTDGKTAETGLTISNTDIKIWKTGATTLADKNSGGATHISGGIYYAVLDATDTNTLGSLVIFVNESGALPIKVECVILSANIYDSMIGGGDVLDVSVTQFNGSNITQSGGRPEVNVSHFGGSAGTFASGRPEVNTTHAAGTAWNSGAIGASTLAADTLTAAKVASDVGTEIGTAVWAAAARTLTANTNLNDLNAAGIRAAVGLSSADLDTQLSGLATASALSTVAGYIDTEIGTILTNLATVDTVVDSIKAVTDLLPDAGALTSLATAAALSTVDTNVDTLLTNIGTPIGTTIADQLSDSYTAIQQVANVTDMLVHTSGKLWVLDDNGNPLPNASDVAAIKAVTDKLDDTLEDDGGTYRFTTNALEQAPSGGGGGGLDAAGVRAAIGLASANLDTQLSGINTNIDGVETKIDTIDGVADAIKAKTDNLPSDPADQSLIMAAIDDLPTNAELATALGTADDAVLSAVATIDTAVGGIALKVADLWALDGLDISNPMTVTPTSRTTGTIAQTISGDGTTTSTVTRTA